MWKKRNKLSVQEASELLDLTPSSINSINSSDRFTTNHYRIMDLVDEKRVLQEQVTSLAVKLADAS